MLSIIEKDIDYPERIVLSDLTHMMCMADLITIGVDTLSIDIGCSFTRELSELICMNPLLVLYLTSCHGCVRCPFT